MNLLLGMNMASNGVTPGGLPVSSPTIWFDTNYGAFQETSGAGASTPSANGDPVGTWRARTGQNASAATNAKRPLFASNAGLPYLQGDGVDDLLVLGDMSALFPSAATIITRFNDLNVSTSTSLAAMQTAANSSYERFSGGGGYAGHLRNARIGAASPTPNNGKSTIVIRSDASAWTYRLNGVNGSNLGADYYGGNAWELFGASSSTVFSNMRSAGYIAYNRILNDTEVALVEAYLAIAMP